MIWIGVHTCEATETFLMVDLYCNIVLSRQFMDLGVYQMVVCIVDRCRFSRPSFRVSGINMSVEWIFHPRVKVIWVMWSGWSMVIWVISQFSVVAWRASDDRSTWSAGSWLSQGRWVDVFTALWWMEIQWRGWRIFHVANWNITML